MAKTKTRKQKAEEYERKYSEIPKDYNERINDLYAKYNYNQKDIDKLDELSRRIKEELIYDELLIILYEEPEGSPRPRFRLINKKNLSNPSFKNGSFVHVYSPVASGDSKHMKKILETDTIDLNQLICTPCMITIDAYIKTPGYYNRTDTLLSERGLIRPVSKPDWDNIGKKYSDMFNGNIWIDDAYVVSGTVNKWYSVLPRVEIKIKYLNKLYNRHQYNSTVKKIDENYTIDYFKK